MAEKAINNPFNLDEQWKFYLHLSKQDETKMSPVQLQETKRAFYAGIGQLLVLLRDTMFDMTDDDAVEKLESMFSQVSDFWLKQSNQIN